MKRVIIPVIIALAAMLALFLFQPKNYISQENEIIIKTSESVKPPTATKVIFVEDLIAEEESYEPENVSATPELYSGGEDAIYGIQENEESYEVPEEASEETSEEPEQDEVETAEEPVSDDGLLYLGTWTATGYCQCEECCGSWAGGPTASGTWPEAGRTIACDMFPFGTQLLIDGEVYVIEDLGVYGEWVDIFFDTHEEALAWGMRNVEVYLIG